MRRMFAILVLVLLPINLRAQSNPCVADSSTNCTSGTGDPFVISVAEPAVGWPYLCVGGQLSLTALPTNGLPGLIDISTVAEDCSISDTILFDTNAIITNWWQATGDPYVGWGVGSNAVFTPTNCGTGSIIFHITYLEDALCGGDTNSVDMTNFYSAVGVYALAPTNNTNCTLVGGSATLQTYAIPVSTNPAVSNLEIVATPCPSVAPSDLPDCWSLDDQRTNVTFIPITEPGIYTVICYAGSSAMTNVIYVTNPGGDVEESCATNWPQILGYWGFDNSLLDWWPGQGNTDDIVGTNNGIIEGAVSYTPVGSGQAFSFNGGDILLGTNTGNFGTNNFTIDLWVQTEATQAQPLLFKEGTGRLYLWDLYMNTAGNLVFSKYDGIYPYYTSFQSQAQINDGSFHEVTVTLNGSSLIFYIDGHLDGMTNIGAVVDLIGAGEAIAGGDMRANTTNQFFGLLQNIKLSSGSAGPWVGNLNQEPLMAYELQNPPSPWGDALKVDTNVPANLSYPYMESDGTANINCVTGAVSFWFKPDWNGGAGPANGGSLLEMGDVNSAEGWWSLLVDGDGANLLFQSKSEGVLNTYLTLPITNWTSNNWYQIVLNYSPEATSLYTNGVLAQTGSGLVRYPSIGDRLEYGFSIGSDHTGSNQIHGVIDEFYTFDCPLTDQEVGGGFPGYVGYPAGSPSIVIQPISQIVNTAMNPTYYVVAQGIPPLNYQWRFNGTPISGATASSLTLTNASSTQQGSYFVIVSNPSGMVNSSNATLTVVDPENAVLANIVQPPTGTPLTNFTFQSDTTYLINGPVLLCGTITFEGGTVIKFALDNSAQLDLLSTNVIWATTTYQPAVFTSVNDDSVGDVVSGSTGNPWGNAATVAALYFPEGIAAPHNVRFSHLGACLSFQDSAANAGGNLTMSDFQVVDCAQMLMSTSGTNVLFNGLIVGTSNIFGAYGGGGTVGQILTAINVTAHDCDNYALDNASSLYFTNCIFACVTNVYSNPNSVQAVSSYFLSYDTGIFQTVGAAAHYLPSTSPYISGGSTNLGPAALADLSSKTVFAPTCIPAAFANGYTMTSGIFSYEGSSLPEGQDVTNNCTFSPTVSRDANASTVALGYHYDPVDYALSISVSDATIMTTPGTVLATMGPEFGIGIDRYSSSSSPATFNCTGTATRPNYIVRYNTVQEQANTNWESTNWISSVVMPADIDPLATVRFTSAEWSVLSHDMQFLMSVDSGENPNNQPPVIFQDCQFYNGMLQIIGETVTSSNCLLRRVYVSIEDAEADASLTTSNTVCNNLLQDGALSLRHLSSNAGIWAFRDNLFDQTSVTATTESTDVFTNNAYVSTSYGSLPASQGDVTLTTSPAYQTGLLGNYYYPPTQNNLIHAGSRSAIAAGLNNYTMTTNNILDGTNKVSIGFHYQGIDTNGLAYYWEQEYFGVVGANPVGNPAGDGIDNADKYLMGLNPNINYTTQSNQRANYLYDGTGRLILVSGISAEAFTFDFEGNIQQDLP